MIYKSECPVEEGKEYGLLMKTEGAPGLLNIENELASSHKPRRVYDERLVVLWYRGDNLIGVDISGEGAVAPEGATSAAFVLTRYQERQAALALAKKLENKLGG